MTSNPSPFIGKSGQTAAERGALVSGKDSLGTQRDLLTTTDGKLEVNASITASVDTTGLATEAKQDDIIAALGSVSVDTTGLATDTKQDTGNASLASIDGKITAVNTGAVVVSSSALPTGAATSAKQDDIITAIGAIPGGGGVQYEDGDAVASPTGTQVMFDDGGTQTAVSTANPLPVSASIDTTGLALAANQQTDALTDTELRATPVPVSGTITANIGTVSTLATAAKQDTGNTSLASIDGKITAVNTGAVVVSSSALPSGAATAANQQTDALTDTELRATPVPVSGTVTANLSATDNGVLDNIDTSTAAINTKTPDLGQALAAASVPVVLPAAQITTLTPQTDALTDTQLRATAVPVSATDLDIRALVNTDVVTAELSATDNAVLDTIDAVLDTIKVDTEAIETAVEAIQAGQLPDGHNVTVDNASIAVTGTFFQATQPVSGTVTANLAAGTNAIGKLAANSGVDIGDVDVTSAVITGGAVAHDATDSGNPIKIGYKAETSPKGITLVADGDRTDAYADADGLMLAKLNTTGADLISERVSNTDGNSTAFTNFAAVASTKAYVTAFSVFRTDAGTTPIYVDFRDGTGGSVLWSAVIPPNGGSNNPAYCGPALFHTSANTALAYDVSAATTTVFISVSGYYSKV